MIDRQKLIGQILEALWRDFNGQQRSGLTRLYDALEVTPDEIVASQSEYFRLLQHDAPNVVTFALKYIKTIKNHAMFDADGAIQSLAGVMSIGTKSQPTSALGLLKTLVASNSSLLSQAIGIAIAALQHPESDVQTAAVELLEKWSQRASLPIELLTVAVASASPIIRPRIESLIGHTRSAAMTNSTDAVSELPKPIVAALDDVEATQNSSKIDSLRTIIASLPPDVCDALRLVESLQSVVEGTTLPEVDFAQLPLAQRTLVPVTPIREIEELIDTINALVEQIASPLDVERVLDGIQVIGQTIPRTLTRVLPRSYRD